MLKQFKIESNKVKQHYANQGDGEKYKAAKFLLENIPSHKYEVCQFFDAQGEEVIIDEFDYDDSDLADKDINYLFEDGGRSKVKVYYDMQNIKAEELIAHIEVSFKAWRTSPWSKSYNFDTFCEYILPYRNIVEPVAMDWKQRYYEQYYTPVMENSEDINDPVSACSELLKEMGGFGFLMTRIHPQPVLSLDQMHFRKKGTCVDLASAALSNSRAIGLAVTYDYTPHNAASSNRHYWNTILNIEGEYIPFNGHKDLPYIYDPNHRRLGKVFRNTFSVQQNSLGRQLKRKRIPEKRLRSVHILDVTDEYVDTFDISYKFDSKLEDGIGYITVFNKGRWRAVWWSKADVNGKAIFNKMGSNVVYLAAKPKEAYYKSKKKMVLDYEKYPILLDKRGKQYLLKPDFGNTFKCSISRNNEEVGPYRDFNTLELKDGELYNLSYWDEEWKLIKKIKSVNGSIVYESFPKNTLFKLTPESADNFERIFTIDNQDCKIIWF